ncbi:hypothetical protein B5S33_g4906 [[Candida] boidinii]|nr:hypothetical protein B5S30_g5698 [[Candida] boidinii]OWB86222.1 hypothetical protein B5S33_g4906 [[Candida] boidinii]
MTDFYRIPDHSHTPQTSNFTCNSCAAAFTSSEFQRLHMKTEWHRYNLKRRVAGLPSVTSAIFSSKVAQSQQKDLEDKNEDELGFYIHRKKKSNFNRQQTKKDSKRLQNRGRIVGSNNINRHLSPASSVLSANSRFSLASSGTLNTHSNSTDTDDLKSESSAAYESDENFYSPSEAETNDEMIDDDLTDEEVEIPISTCFYCGHENSSTESNIEHMFQKHGLYIPDKRYLDDLEGLLQYLAFKIGIENECIKCGFVGKNLTSIRQHVSKKGHCVIPYETRDEREAIAKYYDFSMNKNNIANDEKENENESGIDAEGNHNDNEDEDEYSCYATVHIDETGVEMTLPNGKKLGNRRMNRYYRQNIPDERTYDDGERTVSLVYDNSSLKALQALRHSNQEVGVMTMKRNSTELKQKLKKCNHLEYYRNQRFG